MGKSTYPHHDLRPDEAAIRAALQPGRTGYNVINKINVLTVSELEQMNRTILRRVGLDSCEEVVYQLERNHIGQVTRCICGYVSFVRQRTTYLPR